MGQKTDGKIDKIENEKQKHFFFILISSEYPTEQYFYALNY